ncbi:hypothetical protein McanCB56680_005166 [Microsporum canis]
MIKLLFKLGHDINGMNSGRKTALYYTAKKRMLSIMELLLDLGADPNILHAGRKNSFRLRRIRQALIVQNQPSVPDQPAWFMSDESALPMLDQSVSPGPDRPSSSVPASSTPPSPDHAAPSKPTRSPAPTHQTNLEI